MASGALKKERWHSRVVATETSPEAAETSTITSSGMMGAAVPVRGGASEERSGDEAIMVVENYDLCGNAGCAIL